jgi:hypothetical protein
MITVAGAAHRSFPFPAGCPAAFDFYSHARRTLSILPHISILRQYGPDRFRVLYHTTELGIYQVRLICDIQVEIDRQNWVLRIRPLDGVAPVGSEAGLYSLTAPACFTSESIFTPAGEATQVDYRLKLWAELPAPFGIRLMPERVLDSIAHSITEWRIDEIAGGFIERSIRHYQSIGETTP